jgi:hypothetical protein
MLQTLMGLGTCRLFSEPGSWKLGDRTGLYLAGILVHCDVDDPVVVVALLQDGFVDGQVPILPHLPEGERDMDTVSIDPIEASGGGRPFTRASGLTGTQKTSGTENHVQKKHSVKSFNRYNDKNVLARANHKTEHFRI